MCEKIIFHIDVNAAFLSWEAVYRLRVLGGTKDLREIPCAVAGDVKKRHGIILAKSTLAKKYGIQTGELVAEALKKCPGLELVPPHYDLYDTCSAAFMEILRRFSPIVEQYSIDEAYCDMTGTCGMYGSPAAAAQLIRRTIRDELGFTVNVGVSSNKLLAKMASDLKKPDMVHTLFPDEIRRKMWPLPVSELFFVGRATTRKLFSLGIRTIGELAQADPCLLKAHLKKHGLLIHQFANGIDSSEVLEEIPANKGYGNSMTMPFDAQSHEMAEHVLQALCETVGSRLRKDKVLCGVVAVDIVYADFERISHQMHLEEPTDVTRILVRAAARLFRESWNGMPVRHLGIHTSGIIPKPEEQQILLFGWERLKKLQDIDRTADEIRNRFGEDSLKRAVYLNSPICHMAGGISREKKSVNYQEVNVE